MDITEYKPHANLKIMEDLTQASSSSPNEWFSKFIMIIIINTIKAEPF